MITFVPGKCLFGYTHTCTISCVNTTAHKYCGLVHSHGQGTASLWSCNVSKHPPGLQKPVQDIPTFIPHRRLKRKQEMTTHHSPQCSRYRTLNLHYSYWNKFPPDAIYHQTPFLSLNLENTFFFFFFENSKRLQRQ